MKEIRFKGQIWFKDDGCLTDRFINWISKKRQAEEMWGKQCEVIIKLEENKNERTSRNKDK